MNASSIAGCQLLPITRAALTATLMLETQNALVVDQTHRSRYHSVTALCYRAVTPPSSGKVEFLRVSRQAKEFDEVPCCVPKTRPRDRIVTTARDLFHRYGIRGIGVDAIAEAAGTNKMTLYRHFGSKDDLILECLHGIVAEVEAMWKGFEAEFPGDPLAQLRAWVACGAECISSGDRGCELANAAVELTESGHPARRFIEGFKQAQRERITSLCRSAGVVQAELLADTLVLLFEGARVSRQSVGSCGPSARFAQMSAAVIDSFAAK